MKIRCALALALLVSVAAPTHAQQAGPYFRLRLQSSGFTPPTGYLNVYAKSSNKHLYIRDSTGTETDITGSTTAGTVTSVGMTVPSWLSVSGSPVTSSGTLAVTAATGQTQNRVLASPNGSSGAVSLRALVAADLPGVTGVAGSYTNADITVDGYGRITAAANGSGGSTGNYSFSSNSMDLSGAATMSIAPTTATALTLGQNTTIADAKTLTLSYNSITTGQTVSLLTQNTTAATVGAQKYSPMIALAGSGWKTDATAASQAVAWGMQVRPVQSAAAPYSILDFSTSVNGGAYTKRLGFNFGTTAYPFIESASNTIALYNDNTEGFLVNGADLVFRTNGASYWTMSGATFISSDNAGQVGTSAAKLAALWGYNYGGKQQTVTSSGAVSVTVTSGETYRLLANGNVTSLTLADGKEGEVITLILVQDAGGTSTWPSTISNARIAGGSITKTAAANAIDTITLRWDTSSSDWIEMSRSLNNS